jgi:SRSO17 transposase
MDGGSNEGSEARFAGYVEALGVVLGHADRPQPMHDYCLGLLMSIDRKPERHIPNSIATIRRRLIVALAKTLPRCPCCNTPIRKTARIPDY